MAWTRTRLEVPATTGDPSVLLAVPPPDGGWTPRLDRAVTIGTIRPDRMATTGPLSEPTIPVSPQTAGPAVPEREIGPGGVSGCSAMPGSEKVQPARQSSRIQGGQDTIERHAGMGEGEGSGGGDGGGQGSAPPGSGVRRGGAPRQPQCITLGRLAPLHYAVRRRPRCPRLARRGGAPCEAGVGGGTVGTGRIATTGPLSEPTIPVSPQAARPAVSETETGQDYPTLIFLSTGGLILVDLGDLQAVRAWEIGVIRALRRTCHLKSGSVGSPWKRVQAAFRGVLVCQGVRKSSLPGKARGFRGSGHRRTP